MCAKASEVIGTYALVQAAGVQIVRSLMNRQTKKDARVRALKAYIYECQKAS
jgi:hypothetical protein